MENLKKCKQSQAKETKIRHDYTESPRLVANSLILPAPAAPAYPTGQQYLELGQLLAVVEDTEAVEVVWAWVWDHLTAHQAQGLLGHLAAVPVLVKVQVTVPDGAPA